MVATSGLLVGMPRLILTCAFKLAVLTLTSERVLTVSV
ncbi:hypothetical protein N644_2812 [Lactiplantibacillus paraplantarum]|nr:hypothetical protein N644_2812 [Lactiplantibacillus paraplantarum]